MKWWQKLTQNNLARFGATLLLCFYIIVIFAEFIAPYSPFTSQPDGSLLPPTTIYWRTPQGQFIGPHVYPTTQGPVSLETGERELKVDRSLPAPIRLFVKGEPYRFLSLRFPLPTNFSLTDPQITEIQFFPGFPGDRHLFGTVNLNTASLNTASLNPDSLNPGSANPVTPARLNLLGTDEQARDQFSRLVYGGRISLFIGIVGVAVSFPIGMIVGGISGYFGGFTDAVLMRIVEVLMTVPSIYLLVSLKAIFPPKLTSFEEFLLITLVTSFVGWAGLARVVRGQVLSIKEREFVQAAKVMGAQPLYVILKHVLPQTASYIVISATLAIPSFIVAEAVLSLIGLGIKPPDPSWGNMLSLATNASILVLQPWLVWSPAILIVLTILAFNLLGDGLRDALDPRNSK